jgi:multiple antibiotic resistance protein
MIKAFLLSFAAIFFIVDPIGIVPIFVSMTARDTTEKCRAMARRACLTASGVMIFFALGGALLLQVFSLTLGAFRVAGGLLLLITALDMLRARHVATRTSPAEEREGEARDDIAIVPLAMPLLAGPGAIATAMVLMAQHGGTVEGKAAVIAAILLTMLIAWLLLRSAQRIKKILGRTGIAVLERVFGLILAAIAVQFLFDGAKELWR